MEIRKISRIFVLTKQIREMDELIRINISDDNKFDEVAKVLFRTNQKKMSTHEKVFSWCLENNTDGLVQWDRKQISKDLEISSTNAYNSFTILKDLGLIEEGNYLSSALTKDYISTIKEIKISCVI